jgi:hypothetical protein
VISTPSVSSKSTNGSKSIRNIPAVSKSKYRSSYEDRRTSQLPKVEDVRKRVSYDHSKDINRDEYVREEERERNIRKEKKRKRVTRVDHFSGDKTEYVVKICNEERLMTFDDIHIHLRNHDVADYRHLTSNGASDMQNKISDMFDTTNPDVRKRYSVALIFKLSGGKKSIGYFGIGTYLTGINGLAKKKKYRSARFYVTGSRGRPRTYNIDISKILRLYVSYSYLKGASSKKGGPVTRSQLIARLKNSVIGAERILSSLRRRDQIDKKRMASRAKTKKRKADSKTKKESKKEPEVELEIESKQLHRTTSVPKSIRSIKTDARSTRSSRSSRSRRRSDSKYSRSVESNTPAKQKSKINSLLGEDLRDKKSTTYKFRKG